MKNFTLKFALSVMLGIGLTLTAMAQNVRGGVQGPDGQPVIGASVIVEGTTLGTSTGIDGSFSLDVPDASKNFLNISYIGMKSQRVAVNGRTRVDVVLEEDATTLDDVVVIGYGTVKRRDVTGAVASVTGETLSTNPVSDVSQALQGRLPGVSVISQDGRPGADVSIRVRGGGSITQSNEPLFIVDGFPVGSISDIPADQIETIDVLKDASATAIYGARGANGVILVTTKGVGQERVSVSYNGYVQIKTVAKTLDVLDAQDYVYHNWAFATFNSASDGDGMAKYFGLGSQYGNHYADYAGVEAHDWTDDLLRNALSHSHNFTVSGGGEKTKMVFNANYLNDEGLKLQSGYERANASLKLQQKLHKRLTLDMDVRYMQSKLDGEDSRMVVNGRGSLLSSAYRYRPIDTPLGDLSATDMFGLGSNNIDENYNVKTRMLAHRDITKTQQIRGNGALAWEIVDGLTARTEIGLARTYTQTWNWCDKSDPDIYSGYGGNKRASLQKKEGWNVRSATTINYQVQGLGENHDLSFLVGNEVLASKSDYSRMIGYGYIDEYDMDRAFANINQYLDAKQSSFTNVIGTPDHTVSFFGRANYSLKGRYLFTATFRADGASNFAPNNRWGYFPAGAFAWRLSDEPFLADSRDWLDNLKVRVSFGSVGNNAISSGLWKLAWQTSSTQTTYPINGVYDYPFEHGENKPNLDLKWETTITRNLGVDFGFWNNRLYGSVDAYWNSTKDLLMRIPINAAEGYSFQYQNIGKTSNKGVEISVGGDIIRKKDFTFGITANYNYNRNNIDKLADNLPESATRYSSRWGSSDQKPAYDYAFIKGSPVGVVMGYVCDGFYGVDDFNYDAATGVWTLREGVLDIDNAITSMPTSPFALPEGQTAFPGMMKIRDVNGDGSITVDDYTDLGEIYARHTGAFALNLNWKGIDFSANFNWQYGGLVYNANALAGMSSGTSGSSYGSNRLASVKDCFRIYDINAAGDLEAVTTPDALRALNAGAKYYLPYGANGVTTSTFMEDASYLRLQTLTLGYTLPKKVTTKFGVQRLRVYFTAGNVFTVTGYSGLDPEVNSNPKMNSSSTGGYPTVGLDWGAYPRARTFTFGVNVDF